MFYVSWDNVVSIVFAGVIPTFEQLQALADALGVVQGEDVWIFDFLNYMTDLPEYLESFYFWKINNNGCKHLQVRFYSK